MSDRPDASPAAPRRRTRLVAAAAGAVIGLAAVYGIGAWQRNAAVDPACHSAAAVADRIAPLARGEVAAVAVASTPARLPELHFQDQAGAAKTLADWRGRTVLLNLWATWCVPCRKEMPALAELQQKLGGADFEVVAVNIDTRDPAKPKAWLEEVGITGLAYYADPSAKVFQQLKGAGKALGMPTTVLVDPQGCEIATLNGPAEWASQDALALVTTTLRR